MPTTDQLLEMEKRGLLTEQQQNTINGLRDRQAFPPPVTIQTGKQQVADNQQFATPAAGQAAPSPAPMAAHPTTAEPAPAAPTPAADAMKGVHNPLKVGAYRLASMAADYNAAAYSHGFLWSPKEFKSWMQTLGVPGAENLRETQPETWAQDVQGALGPFQWMAPSIPVAGVLAESVLGSQKAGDVAEAMVGGVQAIKQMAGLASWAGSTIKSVRAAGKAAKTPEQVFAALRGMRDDAARAELAYSIAATERRQAMWGALKASARPSQIPTPESEFQRISALHEGAPSPLEVGRDVQATGRQKYAIPGGNVGAQAMETRAAVTTKRLFDRTIKASDTAQVGYDRSSAGMLDVRMRTAGLMNRLASGEKLFGKPLSMDEGTLLSKLHAVGGNVNLDDTGAPVGKLSELMDLYGEARRALGDKALYPILNSDAEKEFTGITDALGRVIRTEVAQDQKTATLWDAATAHVLEVREPTRVSTTHILGRKGTSTAGGALRRATLGDPRDLLNELRQAGPAWSQRMRQGAFGEMLRKSHGDMGKVLKDWESLQPETKMMLAAPTTPRSSQALADVLRRGKPIQQAQANWAEDLRKAAPDLQVGVDQITQTLRAAAQNVHTLKPRAAGVFGSYHLVKGAMMSFVNPTFATYHFGSYLLMTRPGLVRALFTLPPQSVAWTQAAAAAEAVLTPFAHQQQRRQDVAAQQQPTAAGR